MGSERVAVRVSTSFTSCFIGDVFRRQSSTSNQRCSL